MQLDPHIVMVEHCVIMFLLYLWLPDCGVITGKLHLNWPKCAWSVPMLLGLKFWRTLFSLVRYSTIGALRVHGWIWKFCSFPGVGSFTIVDDHKVTGADVGNKWVGFYQYCPAPYLFVSLPVWSILTGNLPTPWYIPLCSFFLDKDSIGKVCALVM